MYEDKIILRSVFKVTRCWMEPARDPRTNRFSSSVRLVNSQGDKVLDDDDRKSKEFLIAENDIIEIFDGKTFDLDDPIDKAWWEAIRYSKKIAQDRWEKDAAGNLTVDGNSKRYGNAEFYVERPGHEAKQRNDRKRAIHEARSYVYQDTPENLYSKVRLLGNPMPGSTISDVEDYLIQLAERSPNLITELYTGSDTHLRLFFLDAMDKRIIFSKDKLFYYGEIVIGATDTAVISFFKNPDNKRINDLIKREVYPEMFAGKAIEVDPYDKEIAAEALAGTHIPKSKAVK